MLLLAFLIGVIAGLRSLTAPAAVAWGAGRHWLNLQGTPFAFMGSTAAVAVFTLLAIGELIADKLPSTPNRTSVPGLGTRVVMGALSGAAIASAGGQSFVLGAVLGAAGGIAGTYAGYRGPDAPGEESRGAGPRNRAAGRPCRDWWRSADRVAGLIAPAIAADPGSCGP